MYENLTTKNALLYATKVYDNPECLSVDEFLEDYKRFKYVKRLCRRYVAKRHVSERLMLNHIIALLNVFGAAATVRLIFVKCDDEHAYRVIKPFLTYLNVLPDVITGIDGSDVITESIPSDDKILQRLRAL